jgi:hypothetical protein
MGSTTYKASFDNILGTSGDKELTTHGLINGTLNYGSPVSMYPSSTTSSDAIHLRDQGHFKLALLQVANTSTGSSGAIAVQIKMGDSNYYKLFDFAYTSRSGFFNLLSSETPLYFNGSDVEIYSQRGGGGSAVWTASHADYIKDV